MLTSLRREDVKKALDTLSQLGASCYSKKMLHRVLKIIELIIVTGDYVCSVPSILSNDSMDLVKFAEQVFHF